MPSLAYIRVNEVLHLSEVIVSSLIRSECKLSVVKYQSVRFHIVHKTSVDHLLTHTIQEGYR